MLLVLDGLGWHQLQRFSDLMPVVSTFEGSSITTVAPSTTAAALTSITTALPPGEHGIVGYRMLVDDDIFNCLRWGTSDRPDCRRTIPPQLIQPYQPFMGRGISLVTKADFRSSGFSQAHLRGGNLVGYRTTAVLVHEVARLIEEGEEIVYAYYDGIDKVAHEYGLRSEYCSELRFVDRLVEDLLESLPSGTSVMVTADHGQVDCGVGNVSLHPDVMAMTDRLSGEARFRWLHSEADQDELIATTKHYHGSQAWVVGREQMIEEKWFGPVVSAEAERRLGDVALLSNDTGGFADPADTGPFELIGRHGSLTAEEMLVPCIVATV